MPASPEVIWRALLDPDVLARVIPGATRSIRSGRMNIAPTSPSASELSRAASPLASR